MQAVMTQLRLIVRLSVFVIEYNSINRCSPTPYTIYWQLRTSRSKTTKGQD